MKIDGIVESCLYVADLDRAAQFYENLFGLELLSGDHRFRAFALPGAAVLLLFKRGETLEPVSIPGGTIPTHDGSGHLHVAFKISAGSLEPWKRELEGRGIEIESVVHWPAGGVSLYFRDPDGHLIELITPGCWPVY